MVKIINPLVASDFCCLCLTPTTQVLQYKTRRLDCGAGVCVHAGVLSNNVYYQTVIKANYSGFRM